MRKVTISVLVLLVLLVAADRVGALVADVGLEGVLKDRLDLSHKPKVRVHGIPFLTQVGHGDYRNVEVSASDVTAGSVHGLDADIHLHDAHVPAKDLFSWHIDSVPVDRVDGTVTVPYSQVAARSGIDGLTISDAGGKLRMSAPLSVGGQSVRVSAVGHAEVTGGAIEVIPDSATAGGQQVPSSIVDPLRYRIPVTNLPFHLQISSVQATKDGLAVSASATNVTITSSGVRAGG